MLTFLLRKGEAQAMIGENGAGKSTLMKVLSGAIIPDQGDIFFEDSKLEIRNPRDALKLGIRTVYQEMILIPQLDVARNIFCRWWW